MPSCPLSLPGPVATAAATTILRGSWPCLSSQSWPAASVHASAAKLVGGHTHRDNRPSYEKQDCCLCTCAARRPPPTDRQFKQLTSSFFWGFVVCGYPQTMNQPNSLVSLFMSISNNHQLHKHLLSLCHHLLICCQRSLLHSALWQSWPCEQGTFYIEEII